MGKNLHFFLNFLIKIRSRETTGRGKGRKMNKERLKILIVDDTPMNLVLLEQLLKDCDCTIYPAQSGAEAVQLAKEHDFAVALLDIQMPEMDGYETAKAIKDIRSARYTPIIFVTSIFQDERSVKLGYEVGAVDYLFRPVDPLMLRAKVKIFMDLHRQRVMLEHEIQQRTRTAEALSRAEVRYRSFFEKAVEGIFQTNLEGSFLDVNPALVRLYGCISASELIGCEGGASGFLINKDDREVYLAALRDEGYVSNWECRIRKADGDEAWLSESSRLVTAEGQEIIEGVVEDITDRKKSEENLQRRATMDALTEIPNRSLFFDRLENALASAKRYGDQLAVLFVDLNEFKNVNDSHGHAMGDEVLKQVAARFRDRVRTADTLARLGGDEFGVVLSAVDSSEAVTKVAESLLAAVEAPFEVNGITVKVGATVGASLFPEHATSGDELLRLADMAMYAAKGEGRALFAFHGEQG